MTKKEEKIILSDKLLIVVEDEKDRKRMTSVQLQLNQKRNKTCTTTRNEEIFFLFLNFKHQKGVAIRRRMMITRTKYM